MRYERVGYLAFAEVATEANQARYEQVDELNIFAFNGRFRSRRAFRSAVKKLNRAGGEIARLIDGNLIKL